MLGYLGIALALAAVALFLGLRRHMNDVLDQERRAEMAPRQATPEDERWTPDADAWDHYANDYADPDS